MLLSIVHALDSASGQDGSRELHWVRLDEAGRPACILVGELQPVVERACGVPEAMDEAT